MRKKQKLLTLILLIIIFIIAVTIFILHYLFTHIWVDKIPSRCNGNNADWYCNSYKVYETGDLIIYLENKMNQTVSSIKIVNFTYSEGNMTSLYIDSQHKNILPKKTIHIRGKFDPNTMTKKGYAIKIEILLYYSLLNGTQDIPFKLDIFTRVK